MPINSLLLITLVTVFWSIIPTMKTAQTQVEVPEMSIVMTQQILGLAFALLAFTLFSKTSAKEEFQKIWSMPTKWWIISLLIAGFTIISTFCYTCLTKEQDVSFLIYLKPLSLLLTFIVAGFIFKNKKWNLKKVTGMGLILIGMYLFS